VLGAGLVGAVAAFTAAAIRLVIAMRTLLPDPPPADFEQLLERRRRWGADTHDEVWKGVLHMTPAAHLRHGKIQAQLLRLLGPPADAAGLEIIGEFNLGEPEDYRVPDGGLTRAGPDELWNATAALVVEVLSPGDESWEKLPFYAEHHVDELLIVDPADRAVHWLAFEAQGDYRAIERSGLIDVAAAELASQIDWP